MSSLSQLTTMDFSSEARLEHPLTQPIGDATHSTDGIKHHRPRKPHSPPVQDIQVTLEDGFRGDAIALGERYILDEVLAVGGTGIIYKAHSREAARENERSGAIAVKTLRPELRDNPDAIERLKREFRFTAELTHVNIVRALHLEQMLGTWFLTMELLEGQSLAALLYDSRPTLLPETRAFSILRACNAALTFAHQRGILHCDFKPSNVWLTAAQEVRVIDFGAAQRYTPKVHRDDNHTGRDQTQLPCIATPAYTSPQILAGETPEPRDDVFSFACVAYELFAGQPPFGRLNAAEARGTRMRLRRPKGMSSRRWLVLKRGLHWQRTQRPASVQALLAELEGSSSNAIAAMTSLSRHLHNAYDWSMPRLYSIHNNGQQTLQRTNQRVSRLASTSLRRIRLGARATGTRVSALMRSTALRRTRKPNPITHKATRNIATGKVPIGWRSFNAEGLHQAQPSTRPDNDSIRDPRWDIRFWATSAVALSVVLTSLSIFNREPETISTHSEFAASSARAVTSSASSAIVSELPRKPASLNMLAPLATSIVSWPDAQLLSTADLLDAKPAARPLSATEMLDIGNIGHVESFATYLRQGFAFTPEAAVRVIARPRVSVSLQQASLSVSEQAIAAVLLLKRSGSTRDPVVVNWRTIVGSAKPGVDYQEVAAGTARFADNQSIRALYVSLTPNPAAIGSRSFEVELSRPSAGADLGQIKRAIITIQKVE